MARHGMGQGWYGYRGMVDAAREREWLKNQQMTGVSQDIYDATRERNQAQDYVQTLKDRMGEEKAVEWIKANIEKKDGRYPASEIISKVGALLAEMTGGQE